MKKIIFSLFIILCTSGCWNYKELNEYSIVTGVAIDKKDGKYEVSTLISNTSKTNSSSDDESLALVYSGVGDSVLEAFKDIGLISSKELYLNSFSILVLSEDIAEEGIDNISDFFLRYSSSRNKFYVVISKDNTAKDILKIINNFPKESISDNLESTSNLQGIVSKIGFDQLIQIILRKNMDPVINSIYITKEEEENVENNNKKSLVKIGPLAIFKEDKLVDWANKEESIGINIINNKINEMYININHNDGYVVIETSSFKTNTKTHINKSNPYVNINLNSEAKIIEVKGNIDLKDTKTIKELENKANKKIKEYVWNAIHISIKNNTDVFGFGFKFYQEHPNFYKKLKNKENILGNIKFNISSKLILKNKVSVKNSLEESYEKN